MTADLFAHKRRQGQGALPATSPELLEALQKLVYNAGALLDVPACALALLDATETVLATQRDDQDQPCTSVRFNQEIARLLAQQHEAVLVNDIEGDTRCQAVEEELHGSFMCVPLLDQEQFIATLTAYSPQLNAFSQRQLHMLTLIGEQIVLVLHMSQRAEKAHSKMLSMITHELRAPINTINGYLDLALAGIAGELGAEQREFIQRARSGSESLFALIEDALFIARVDAGQLRLSREIVSLQEIIPNAVEEMELTAKDHDIAITLAIDERLPALYADATRLQHVLRNLLSNALHFTPPGGLVTVSALFDQINADAVERPRSVALQVKDSGCGIAPAFQQRIFEPFFQVPGNKELGYTGGQGLGLAVVRKIVELHGGHVSVESELGHGSTFLCTLPALLE